MNFRGSIVAFVFTVLLASTVSASGGKSGFGLSAGMGLPFLQQVGLDYQISSKWGMYLGYNQLSLTSGAASLVFAMPELTVKFHPFAGAYFLGIGVGQESLKSKATDVLTGAEASIEVSAMTTIVKTGFMWGLADGGLWFGIDMSFISPSSPKYTITAPGVSPTSSAYLDAVDAAEKFGETSFTNLTFARIGYIF